MADGWYLFREGEGRWWRATRVDAGEATAGWIAGSIPIAELPGEWCGPLDEDDPDVAEARRDEMGRLMRRPPSATAPESPPAG